MIDAIQIERARKVEALETARSHLAELEQGLLPRWRQRAEHQAAVIRQIERDIALLDRQSQPAPKGGMDADRPASPDEKQSGVEGAGSEPPAPPETGSEERSQPPVSLTERELRIVDAMQSYAGSLTRAGFPHRNRLNQHWDGKPPITADEVEKLWPLARDRLAQRLQSDK